MTGEVTEAMNVDLIAKPYSYQRELFPVEIIEYYPSDQNSADLKLIGCGRNGKDYAIKRVCDGNSMIPAAEFFCYELARKLGIPTPEFDVLQLDNGELAFGSVWEGGVQPLSDMNAVVELLTQGTLNGTTVKSATLFFSRVYAFDLFVNNVDRHWGNYIFRHSYHGIIALAFDFSRAWCEVAHDGFHALEANCNTQKTIRIIQRLKKFDAIEAGRILDDIGDISPQTIAALLSEMPDQWMTKQQITTIINAWSSNAFSDRLTILQQKVSHVLV